MTFPLGNHQLVNEILTVTTNFTLNEKQNIILFEKCLSDTFHVFENENLDHLKI